MSRKYLLSWAVVLALIGCGLLLIPRWWELVHRSPGTHVAAEQVAAAQHALVGLPVVESVQVEGYDRTFFGQGWLDLDGNGCDTRVDVLAAWIAPKAADQAAATTPQNCEVAAGDFVDPYSGFLQRYRPGTDTGGEVHIDHVVALKDAWVKGAWQWDSATAWQFANDPANLVPTNAHINMDKSDSDAAEWLPPHEGYHCAYVVAQIQVKAAYQLGVSTAEKEAMISVLANCE